jgi:hypothetical protein
MWIARPARRRFVPNVLAAHSQSAREKRPSAKSAHASMPKAVIAEVPWMAPQPATPHSVNLVLEFRPASLPVLNSATTTKGPAEASFAYREQVNDEAGFHGSNPVWNESSRKPSEVAQACDRRNHKWGECATGRIDVDDRDGRIRKVTSSDQEPGSSPRLAAADQLAEGIMRDIDNLSPSSFQTCGSSNEVKLKSY